MPYLGRSKAASAFLNNKIDVGFYVVHGEGVLARLRESPFLGCSVLC